MRGQALPRLLGGRLIEWLDGETVIARLRVVTLPDGLRLHAEGLVPGRHVALISGAGEACGVVDATGKVLLDLTLPEGRPDLVLLRLSDPACGSALDLEAPWPTRVELILDPEARGWSVIVRSRLDRCGVGGASCRRGVARCRCALAGPVLLWGSIPKAISG